MAPRKKPSVPKPSLLDEGDWVTESISMEVSSDPPTWVKVEAGTHVRPGEDHSATNERLYTAVAEMLDENIERLLED
jgi:hypothetical protein